jgi:hypothetical protein
MQTTIMVSYKEWSVEVYEDGNKTMINVAESGSELTVDEFCALSQRIVKASAMLRDITK